MNVLIDLLHLVAAAALSLIGFGYEREPDCNPVRLQPAAMVETVDASAAPEAGERLHMIEDCQGDRRAVRLPAL
jgi:hypothetical protein